MIQGVSGTGSRIDMYFGILQAPKTGKPFPTGKKKKYLMYQFWGIEVTFLDCSESYGIYSSKADLGIQERSWWN